ncbi:hypothetical protein A2U01_0053829 [Trifolium medium]|uniref:Uncharacterized protein n=1 Tax=Trifolium medium TaxID=97028 RepID=A0A392RAN3_9FABA|nr:hypothetical protein [Trifolium medium]
MEESCFACGKSSQGCVDAIRVTQCVLGMKLSRWHTGIGCHGCKVCDDIVRALVCIDARYAVSMADELSEKASKEVAP